MSCDYKGMSWLKCDLHMHTPADTRHWLGAPLNTGHEADAARDFAEACYQNKLDVVGITDHNFISKNFISHLQEAFGEIKKKYQHEITLFPGFEIQADVGIGIHVICLFNPRTPIEEIDHILTECGVDYPRIENGNLKKSTKRLPDILDVVQKQNNDGTLRGIVIIPHIFEDSLFDNDRISNWLQQEEYRNPDLLAVEVPKTINSMSNAFQKLFRSGDDCEPSWKRIRPIATLMSSDCKKLVANNGQRTEPNTIGYRYSWVKMSNRSIESLRQAFLDHESRILLPSNILTDIHPSQRNQHSYIKSIDINDVAFLVNQKICFSQNMNCVIGGRGSGKSTILEYLRIVLCKDLLMELDTETIKRIKRTRNTLTPKTEIKVCWVTADGSEDTIVWQNAKSIVPGRNLIDSETFFRSLPITFYSQHQLNHLTDSKAEDGSLPQAKQILGLIDGFVQNELDELKEQERKQKQKIQESFSLLRKVEELKKESNRLRQEYQELDRQWRARSEIQQEAWRHQLLKAEARYLDSVAGIPGRRFSDVVDLAEAIATSHAPFQLTNSIHADWLKQFDDKVKYAKHALASIIREAVENFEVTIENCKIQDPMWPTIQEELEQADSRFRDALAAKGLAEGDVGRLQEIGMARTKKQSEIENIEAKIQQLKEAAGDIEQNMQSLYQIWREQFQKRREAVVRANELAVLDGNTRFIEVSVTFQSDYRSFIELWQSLAPSDGRTRLGRNWENCGKALFDLCAQKNEEKSPWQVLEEHLAAGLSLITSDMEISSHDLLSYIYNNLERWETLQCSRVQDAADIRGDPKTIL